MTIRRLRMFAGPNGSGKSVLKRTIAQMNSNWIGVYINPDEIEKEIVNKGYIDFGQFRIKTNKKEIFDYLKKSPVLAKKKLLSNISKLEFDKNTLFFSKIKINSYYVSALADFIHEKLVKAGISFSRETVMSHPSKVELLKKAQKKGFRTYLYFIATENPEMNIGRVKERVKQGGHDVSDNKVVDRYYKSLNNLLSAIQVTDRAYIFNSPGPTPIYLATITGGKKLVLESSDVPVWFKKYILDKVM